MRVRLLLPVMVGLLSGALAPGPTGVALAQGKPISPADMVARTEATPWECSGYDPATDTCEALSRMRLDGGGVFTEGRFVLVEEPRVVVVLSGTLQPVGDAACIDVGEMELGFDPGTPAEMVAPLRAAIGASLDATGVLCYTYIDRGDGTYLSRATDAGGTPVPDADEEVVFLAAPRELRLPM